MVVRHKPSGKLVTVTQTVANRLVARKDGSYQHVVEEVTKKEKPKKAKKADENTKSESGSSDS